MALEHIWKARPQQPDRESLLNDNGYFGILMDSSTHNNLTGNSANGTAYLTQQAGIVVGNNSDYNDLNNNEAFYNSNSGIWVEESYHNNLIGNYANNNGINGIVLKDSTDTLLSHNFANDNGFIGILLQNASANTLVYNSANGHQGRFTLAAVWYLPEPVE